MTSLVIARVRRDHNGWWAEAGYADNGGFPVFSKSCITYRGAKWKARRMKRRLQNQGVPSYQEWL